MLGIHVPVAMGDFTTVEKIENVFLNHLSSNRMTHPNSRIRRFPKIGDRRHFWRSQSGMMTLLLIVGLVVGLLLLMLVLNWIWLVMNNRDVQRRSDVLAHAAAVELLDESLLEEASPDQTDDVLAAETVVESFRILNNRVSSPVLKIEPTDVTVTPLWVKDITSPNYVSTAPFNTLRVELHRMATGANPVQLLIRGYGGPEAVTVSTTSCVTLDNRVVGFRPVEASPTPLAPLAIEADAWFVDRVTAGIDSNGNNRKEIQVTLLSASGTGLSSAAFVALDQIVPINYDDVVGQIWDGIFPEDLASPVLGPVFPDAPLPLPAENQSNGFTHALVSAFNTVATSDDSQRIFLLYAKPFSDPLEIIGFIGANVLGAANLGGSDFQLAVSLEPVFIVHFTAETNPLAPENVYVHKLRRIQ